MPSINGVNFDNISSLSGVSWNSVTNIGGVSVSHAPTCSRVTYGYADGVIDPPRNACSAEASNYDWDATNGLLYRDGQCGQNFASAGYYSDGVNIYYWDGSSSFSYNTRCGR